MCKVKTTTTRPSAAAPVKTFLFALTSGRAKRSTRSDSQILQNQRSSQILPQSAVLPDPSTISAPPRSFHNQRSSQILPQSALLPDPSAISAPPRSFRNQRSSQILPQSALPPDPSAISAPPRSFHDQPLLHHFEIPLSFVLAFMISV
jgi:hypothetical protein